jgi:hypothetical protein
VDTSTWVNAVRRKFGQAVQPAKNDNESGQRIGNPDQGSTLQFQGGGNHERRSLATLNGAVVLAIFDEGDIARASFTERSRSDNGGGGITFKPSLDQLRKLLDGNHRGRPFIREGGRLRAATVLGAR